jgi:dedicator of cytokinesis protein 3
MPWQPLPRIAFAVATYPFQATSSADLPLELGDELYIIEQGGRDGDWFRGYLVAPPSLLAGLTSIKGQTLEARVFSGIFPRSCVEVREFLGDTGDSDSDSDDDRLNGLANGINTKAKDGKSKGSYAKTNKISGRDGLPALAVPTKRIPGAPKPPAPVPMLKIGDETPTSASEPLVDEIASCLREWQSTNLHELLLTRQYSMLDKMSSLVTTLHQSRRQFLHNVLTSHELQHLREKTVWNLVKGNKLFNGEVVVRDPAERGRVLTGDDSAVEITKLQSMMSLLDEKPVQPVETSTLHHLLIDAKAFIGASSEPTELVFFLASRTPGMPAAPLSEKYIVEMPASGALTTLGETEIRTLFTDLASADIGDLPSTDSELYLVCKVRCTQVTPQTSSRTSSSRNGTPTIEGQGRSRSGSQPPPGSGNSKSGRRSYMWGAKPKAHRSAFSRNIKLGSLSENEEERESREEVRPSTSSDQRPSAPGERPGASTVDLRLSRTVGIGAIKINSIMKQTEEVEKVLTIWAPSPNPSEEKQQPGPGWEDIIPDFLDSKTGQYERSPRAERLQVYLHPFQSLDAEAMIKATPTLLSGVQRTNKMGFSGAPTKQRSDIYITINEAFLPKQALLSRASNGATPLPTNLVGSNLQLTLEVRRPDGEKIEQCIYASSNSQGATTWESTAAERGEAWNQTLRLAILPSEVAQSHLVMTLADAPGPPFAICHVPLWEHHAFIRDGHHSLLLYKFDEMTASPRPSSTGKGGYLTLPWNARGKDDVSKDEAVTGPIATLRIQTYLCSTRFSQDKVLLGLLRWKDQPESELFQLLQRLVFVPEIEIVKLLNDVFDALFGVLVDHAGNDEYEDLVFSALVTVLGITHDRRFNLSPLVDQYAETRFNYPFATPCLVRSFTRLLANPSDPETSRKLRATFKVVRHILKFITQARGQQKEKEAGIGITSTSPGFTRHLRSIFKALDGLMRNTAPILVGSQTLAVQHFHTWLPELTNLLTIEEIVHIAVDFMDSCALVKGKLVLYKLILIINYSKLDLFSQPEQREALSANTVRWIAPHWGRTQQVTDQWRDQVRLCCSILSTQVDGLSTEIPDYVPKIIDSYLAIQAVPKQDKARLSLLFPTTYPFPSRPVCGNAPQFDEALIELSSLLSAISGLPSGMQLELADEELSTILDDVLHVHLSILECEAFPASWLSVRIYHHKSTMKALEYVAALLQESFLPDPDDAESYNTDLWRAFFKTLLKLVGSDALALETFPEQKRRAVWKIAGDVRENGAELLKRTWESIGWDTSSEDRNRFGLAKMGGYQVQYVPSLVAPIIELCLSVHEGLRRVAVEVLQTMIVSEWNLNEDLSVIQTEMIDGLDRLFKSKPLTESILQKLFIQELMTLFDPLSIAPNDPLYEAVKELISTTDEFLDLLVAVHGTDGAGEASHLIHRLRLMEFLRDMQKEDIFIRYVHQLAALQVEGRNPTQAGLALRLHADLYSWDPIGMVPALPDIGYAAQSEFDRKERLYFEMIKNFEDGEAWSSALVAYKELQVQYEENVFDFAKLARTQRAIATVYEAISKNEKPISKYFRVVYKGLGFPPGLRDKQFVFEGYPGERTGAFTDRMQEQHPSAQIVSQTDPDDIEGQYLQISALTPYRNLDHHVFQRAKVPQLVREYLLSSHAQEFSVTVRRSTSGPVAEHSAEKVVYTTVDQFPTILRRSEVIEVTRVKLTAEQTALERITRKTQEMLAVENKVANGDDELTTLLIDSLNISVNPSSDSSVALYRHLLPVPKEEDEGEVMYSPLQSAIKMALIDHAMMIKRCLAMLAKSKNSQMQATCEVLSESMSPPCAI